MNINAKRRVLAFILTCTTGVSVYFSVTEYIQKSHEFKMDSDIAFEVTDAIHEYSSCMNPIRDAPLRQYDTYAAHCKPNDPKQKTEWFADMMNTPSNYRRLLKACEFARGYLGPEFGAEKLVCPENL